MRIATVGDNCIDYYQNLDQGFPGGNPVNVAVYLKRLGVSSSYVGVIGNDRYGKILKEALASKGVDLTHLYEKEGKTAVTQVELVDGERVFGDYDEGVLKDFKLTEEDLEFLASHDLVVSGIWGKVEDRMVDLKSRGCRIAFDFATKLEDPVKEVAIPHVDYAFFAADEDTPELRNFMEIEQRKGPKMVIVTLGEQGSIAYDGQFHRFGIVPCEVVDSMGAGDSYIAGFLKALLEGQTIEECMKKGAENSSVTLGYTGAW
ncbi:fructoselysine 6-kinase [Proteiniclasticum sp. BAD-10]|uniref:Fructoselysine 6-kinase n=1 Tax=Proteiniclasticum sediminis TaxID=2804028 RepID=A0A941HRX5_9CLOT|nr:fructoselysine 6-kinase [Proteiniclasticum sediminis]MBR0577063.1 fructoselysine 6-kinase [Proteiniclasticum sediminis]